MYSTRRSWLLLHPAAYRYELDGKHVDTPLQATSNFTIHHLDRIIRPVIDRGDELFLSVLSTSFSILELSFISRSVIPSCAFRMRTLPSDI